MWWIWTWKSSLAQYAKEYPAVLLMTPEQNIQVEIFVGYVASVEDNAWEIAMGSDVEFESWLKETKERSCFKSEITPAVTDQIMTLSTCSYEFDNARFVLLGVIR